MCIVPKAPAIPQQPKLQPLLTPNSKDSLAQTQGDLKRRMGIASLMVTGAQGVTSAAPVAGKALLGA